MKGRMNSLSRALVVAALGLSACGPVQAKEGKIYVAGENGAEVATVIGMRRLERCSVPAGEIALAKRETYFDMSNGSAGWDRTPLTQVVHTGSGCSSRGLYDFIEKDPVEAGWTLIEDSEALKQAEARICGEPELRDLNPPLDEACKGWGIER